MAPTVGAAWLGIAHHYGWAVAVTSSADDVVLDRRRVELLGPGLPAAPIHHEGGAHDLHRTGEPLDDVALEQLVARVRESAVEMAARALDQLAAAVPVPITCLALRDWPDGFPDDIAVLRRPPFESQADSVMYRQVIAALAEERGLIVHRYDGAKVEKEAESLLGDRARDVLHGPRQVLGPPWNKDHRMALAATIVARAAQR